MTVKRRSHGRNKKVRRRHHSVHAALHSLPRAPLAGRLALWQSQRCRTARRSPTSRRVRTLSLALSGPGHANRVRCVSTARPSRRTRPSSASSCATSSRPLRCVTSRRPRASRATSSPRSTSSSTTVWRRHPPARRACAQPGGPEEPRAAAAQPPGLPEEGLEWLLPRPASPLSPQRIDISGRRRSMLLAQVAHRPSLCVHRRARPCFLCWCDARGAPRA